MKKYIALLLIITAFLVGCNSGESNGIKYELNEDGRYYIVIGMDVEINGDVCIPAEYRNLPVRGIGNEAFIGCAGLTGISLPETVISIGDRAFFGCDSLRYVEMPNVIECSNTAFHGCTSIEKLVITTDILRQLRSSTTRELNFDSIVEISITPGMATDSIPDEIFKDCTKLQKVFIGNAITKIGESAFENCRNLESVILSEGLVSIDQYAFWACSSLNDINLPTTLSWIGEAAFKKCESLERIYLPDSLESIGDSLFSGCKSLCEIRLSPNIKVISNYAFEGCPIYEVSIPYAVMRINTDAFRDTALESAEFVNIENWRAWTDQAIPQDYDLSVVEVYDKYWMGEVLRNGYITEIGRIKLLELSALPNGGDKNASCGIYEQEKKYIPGTYTGVGKGFFGEIVVSVTVDTEKMVSIVVDSNEETAGVGTRVFKILPDLYVEYNSTSIDAVTGATITSKGLRAAVEAALEKAMIEP